MELARRAVSSRQYLPCQSIGPANKENKKISIPYDTAYAGPLGIEFQQNYAGVNILNRKQTISIMIRLL